MQRITILMKGLIMLNLTHIPTHTMKVISDSRKDDGYNPIKSKQDLVDFKRSIKTKSRII